MKKGLDKFINVFDHILCFFGVIFYLTFVACVLIQVISRNFLPNAPSWTEEAARYSFIYMVSFGCAVAVHRNEFVSVEFLYDALEHKYAGVNKVIALVIKIVLLVFNLYILFDCNDTSDAVRILCAGSVVWLNDHRIYLRDLKNDSQLE